MTRQGMNVREIAFVTQVSPALVRDYQELLERYDTPEHKDRLDEIITRAGGTVVDLQEARRGKRGGRGHEG